MQSVWLNWWSADVVGQTHSIIRWAKLLSEKQTDRQYCECTDSAHASVMPPVVQPLS